MQQHVSSIKVENSFLRDQNCNLNHDIQALLHVIHHARSTGHWEVDNLFITILNIFPFLFSHIYTLFFCALLYTYFNTHDCYKLECLQTSKDA